MGMTEKKIKIMFVKKASVELAATKKFLCGITRATAPVSSRPRKVRYV